MIFSDQVRFLVEVLPFVSEEVCFALKGGTALNLFIRDLPRLSVDIDLAYLPVKDRDTSLAEVDVALKRIQSSIENRLPNVSITASLLRGTGYITKLVARRDATTVKIEVTPVLRGSVYPSSICETVSSAQDSFGYAKMSLLSFEDLYGGKLCAALDRQHPRDLFDVKYLLENEGINESLKNTFFVYLISHPRPIVELLNPHRQPIEDIFKSEFEGMTTVPIKLSELEKTREQMIHTIQQSLSDFDKAFLLSVKRGDVDWNKFPIDGIENLPAVRWKMHNLSKMTSEKRKKAIEKLEHFLDSLNTT